MALFSEQELSHAQQVLEQVRGDWLARPGVTAVDLGFKWSAGEMTQKLAIRVHVSQKKPIADLTPAELFPKEIEGIPIDVLEATYGIQQLWQPEDHSQIESAVDGRNRRFDEIPVGVSIGSPYVSAGTLGAKVIDNATGDDMVLSNWHILAGDPDAAMGLPTWQPGRLDGGDDNDAFAELSRWVLGPFDAAVSRITRVRPVLDTTLEGREIHGAKPPQLGMRVWKSGRTTGLTEGFIDGYKMTTSLYYGSAGSRTMREVFRIVPMPGSGNIEVSMGGDSGSVWVEVDSGLAVGLHFAGEVGDAPEHALACDIIPVIETLDVHFPIPVTDPVLPPDEDDSPIIDPVKPIVPPPPDPINEPPLSWWQRFLRFWRRLFGLE